MNREMFHELDIDTDFLAVSFDSLASDDFTIEQVSADVALAASCLGSAGTFGTYGSASGTAGTFGCAGTYGTS